MRFDLITLFPALFEPFRQHGVCGRALVRGIAQLVLWNPRDFTEDVHRTVDDRPYGGGPGMVMKPLPLARAIAAAREAAPGSSVVYMSPQGRRFDQPMAEAASSQSGLILLCGRYEGVDERVLNSLVDEEWSIGDYVLSGGEIAALAVIDSILRLLPGTLGHEESAVQDSFSNGLLDCPHYTRPEEFAGQRVPAVLLSGDHERIRRWRLQQALGRTWQRRPDLLQGRPSTSEEQSLLEEFLRDQGTALKSGDRDDEQHH